MTVDAATTTLARPRLDVGLAFKGGWNAFTADIIPLLVGGLIACILSVVTLGIMAGPLLAGLYGMVLGRIRDGRRAAIGDVFSCAISMTSGARTVPTATGSSWVMDASPSRTSLKR